MVECSQARKPKKTGLIDDLLTFARVQEQLAQDLGLGDNYEITYSLDPKERFLKDLEMENLLPSLLGLKTMAPAKGLFYLMDIGI